jgi:hypothetical protein
MNRTAWTDVLTDFDRVRAHTDPALNETLDADLRDRVGKHRADGPEAVSRRLEELDKTWDVERTLQANAATLALLGALAALSGRRKAAIVPAVVGGFLLQHAIQGWCPPLAVFRRLSVRTRRELDLERFALKVARGDFAEVSADADPDRILNAAAAR